jgi:hypothetical protein
MLTSETIHKVISQNPVALHTSDFVQQAERKVRHYVYSRGGPQTALAPRPSLIYCADTETSTRVRYPHGDSGKHADDFTVSNEKY